MMSNLKKAVSRTTVETISEKSKSIVTVWLSNQKSTTV